MGIDFNGLIKNLAQVSAKITKGKDFNDKTIDSKDELFTYMTGVQGIKNQANVEGADFTEADVEKAAKAELQQCLDYSFGTKELGIEDVNQDAAFSEDEISLENLMSYLDENVDTDKIAKYNEKGLTDADSVEAMSALEKADFDPELVNILVNDDSIAGAVKYIVKDILSNRAESITKSVIDFNGLAYTDAGYDSDIYDTANLLKQDADFSRV